MERNYQRWFRVWILSGVGLAILLLASSVVNYVMTERTTALFNTRREMAREMAALDQIVRDQKPANAALSGILDQVVEDSNGTLAWAQILNREGMVIARSDAAAAPAFTVDYVASRIRERRPVFAVRTTNTGKVVVEAFAIRLPSGSSAESFKAAALKTIAPKSGPANMAFVELASFANSGVLAWPARWTLLLGVSAGLALLGALVVLVIRFRAHLSARRVERQIQIASQVQRGLLPAANMSPRDFELAAEWRPASNVSGDFYDAFNLPSRESVSDTGAAFVIGDVSGKDVPAAMLASLIQGTAHASDWTRSAANHNSATEQLNRLLCERASQERFASLFWGYFDNRTGLLHYVNCGHCAPLLFRARGQSVLRLADGGPVLGLLPRARFEQGAERLEAGDVLVLYSDGVVEAANANGEEFGEDRLIAAVESNLNAEPAQIRDRILRAVRTFTGSDVLVDDQTLLAIRYTGTTVAALETQAA